MPTSQSQKKEAIAQAAEQELASLAGRGVRIAGNACSPIVLVKGDLDDAECAGGELAAGPDGAALRKALGAIGYAPEDFCVLASVAGAGDGGGTLVCEGTPEEVAACGTSYTGQFLAPVLERSRRVEYLDEPSIQSGGSGYEKPEL